MRNGDLAKLFPAKSLATRSLTPSGRIGARPKRMGCAAGMGAGPGRPHASPAGHHDQENETVARMIGKPDARRKIWRTPRMDQPAKFVIRFFETVTHGDPA
jgi:hypothetical protein